MTQWIIPCNINIYDVFGAFKKLKCIEWKQSNRSISTGDEVFIYVGKPVSSIIFKCKVIKANISECRIDDFEFVINGTTFENYGNYMELEMIEKYDPSKFHYDTLVANGLKGRIQGPRRVNELNTLLNSEDLTWVDKVECFNFTNLTVGKEKDAIVKIRVNQSSYRQKLLSMYNKCCLCGVQNDKVLIASHIKPWSCCEPSEKVDVYNGLILCPNHDKLFDTGLISFNNQGNIIISNELSDEERISLNLKNDMKIMLPKYSIKYMEYHNKNIFIK